MDDGIDGTHVYSLEKSHTDNLIQQVFKLILMNSILSNHLRADSVVPLPTTLRLDSRFSIFQSPIPLASSR